MKPDALTIAWYTAALPDDGRVLRGQMFGCPCSFVNGNMFFGTFDRSVVARVGPESAAAHVAGGHGRIFEPMEGRAWKEYVQADTGSVADEVLAAMARDALAFTVTLPAKPAKGEGKGKKKAG